jgi:hypothetical protein
MGNFTKVIIINLWMKKYSYFFSPQKKMYTKKCGLSVQVSSFLSLISGFKKRKRNPFKYEEKNASRWFH